MRLEDCSAVTFARSTTALRLFGLALLAVAGLACSRQPRSTASLRIEAAEREGRLVWPMHAPMCPDASASVGTVFTEDQVTVPAMLLPTNVYPAYPDALREAGIQGEVEMEYVINISGCAEHASIRSISSSHPEFVPPVAAVLRRFRFEPARRGGTRVPQVARQHFSFTLDR